jgi:hypothetical protein
MTDPSDISPPTSVLYRSWVPTTVRLPSETGTGWETVKTYTYKDLRLPINYPDPSAQASNEFANTLEGSGVARIQQILVDSQYLNPTDVAVYGKRDRASVIALKKAMEDSNLNGSKWQDNANSIIANISAGIIPSKNNGTGGGAKAAGSLQITGPQKARQTFDALSRKYIGAQASDVDFADAYNKLVKAQTAAPVKYGTQVINGKTYSVQISDGVDAQDFFESYLFSKINFGSDEIGGAVGQSVAAVKEIGRIYGAKLSTAESGEFAKGLLDGSMNASNIKKVFADRARAKYKALADRVNENVSVYDLVSDYISAKASTLEIDADTLGIDDVADAISGDSLMNMSEFIYKQKQDPRYQFTTQARNDAASFATNLASVFRTGV